MYARRTVLVTLVAGLAGCGGSGDESATAATEDDTAVETTTTSTDGSDSTTATADGSDLRVVTDAFEDGEPIPEKYTDDGADVSPPFTVEAVPSAADTLAVTCLDPDADGFVHWLLWNVPATVDELPEGVPRTETVEELGGARQGTNGFGEVGYRGPSPPEAADPHTYEFTFYAIEGDLDVPAGAEYSSVESALSSASVADRAVYVGTYDR